MLFSPQRQLTFANFDCRPGSARARTAAAALAIWPSIGHDGPLLILAGRSGSGKTHLLHASANLARQHHDGLWRSSTLSAQRLAEEVQRCLHYRDLPLWLNRFASEDFLAIDDVEALAHHSAAADFLLKLLVTSQKVMARCQKQLRCESK